jgi:hypothetical protein
MSNAVKTAELNVHRGRSIADVFEHALRGVRLIVRARRQSRCDRDIPRLSAAEAPDLFVDLSRVPDPATPHDRRRIDEQRQITMSEMLAAMMRAARSLAEKKEATRRVQRTRKHK